MKMSLHEVGLFADGTLILIKMELKKRVALHDKGHLLIDVVEKVLVILCLSH